MTIVALRAEDLHLTCQACRAVVLIPGPFDGPQVAAWTAVHTSPVLTGWAVRLGGGIKQVVRRPPPPSVLERPRPWTG